MKIKTCDVRAGRFPEAGPEDRDEPDQLVWAPACHKQ